MIADKDANVAYISDLLLRDFRKVADALTAALGHNLRTLSGAKDIWCRDYMPIQLSARRFVQFEYKPDYLKDDPDLRTHDGARLLELTRNCPRSKLVIDGGNVVCWEDTAILTNKIYKENSGIERPELRRELRSVLGVDRLIVIPKERGDAIGHSDGVLRFINRDTVLVNDYTDADPEYGKQLAAVLSHHGLKSVPLPYFPMDGPRADPGIPPATGCYINFLQTQDIICVPKFGMSADKEAARVLRRQFPDCKVISVQCACLALHGGVLNCVTWNVRVNANHRRAQ